MAIALSLVLFSTVLALFSTSFSVPMSFGTVRNHEGFLASVRYGRRSYSAAPHASGTSNSNSPEGDIRKDLRHKYQTAHRGYGYYYGSHRIVSADVNDIHQGPHVGVRYGRRSFPEPNYEEYHSASPGGYYYYGNHGRKSNHPQYSHHMIHAASVRYGAPAPQTDSFHGHRHENEAHGTEVHGTKVHNSEAPDMEVPSPPHRGNGLSGISHGPVLGHNHGTYSPFQAIPQKDAHYPTPHGITPQTLQNDHGAPGFPHGHGLIGVSDASKSHINPHGQGVNGVDHFHYHGYY